MFYLLLINKHIYENNNVKTNYFMGQGVGWFVLKRFRQAIVNTPKL